MSDYRSTLLWQRTTAGFDYETYDRTHTITFGSGPSLSTSSAPDYKGDPTKVNPEEMLVAALSSCHMLTFLAVAAKKRFVVDRYEDDAVGFMEKNAAGKMAVTRAVLKPRVVFSGDKQPSAEELARLHASAHDNCFIANSVTTEVAVEPR